MFKSGPVLLGGIRQLCRTATSGSPNQIQSARGRHQERKDGGKQNNTERERKREKQKPLNHNVYSDFP